MGKQTAGWETVVERLEENGALNRKLEVSQNPNHLQAM